MGVLHERTRDVAVLIVCPTAYAAWLLACPFTKWMLLPLAPVVVVLVWHSHHPDKFFRRMALSALGLAGGSMAMPTIRLFAEYRDFRAGFVVESGSALVAGVAIVVSAVFGWLELRRRQEGKPAAPSGGGGNKLSINKSTIENSTIVGGDQHVHHGDDPSAQLDAIEPLVEHGLIPQALAALETLERKQWAGMSPANKYRTRKLQGNSFVKQGEQKRGARLYLEAADYVPGDEKGEVVRAVGYFLLEDNARAHELATKLVEKFPRLAAARAIYIRSGPADALLEDLHPKPWDGLEPEAATAVAERLITAGRHPEAIAVLKSASSPGTRLDYWYAYSMAHFALVELGLPAHKKWDKSEVAEMLRVHNEALSMCRGGFPRIARIPLLLNIASLHHIAGNAEEQWSALSEAHKLDPNEPAIQSRRAQWLTERKRYSEAIEIFDAVLKTGKLDVAPLLISVPLAKRAGPGDYERACSLLEEMADAADTEPKLRRDAVDFLLELSAEKQRWDKVHAYAQRYRGVLGDFDSAYCEAVAFVDAGDKDAATAIAMKLYAGRASLANPQLLRLGILLVQCEQAEEAFQVLAPIAPQDHWGNPTLALLHAARDTERDEFTVRLCRTLTKAGVNEFIVVDSEAVCLAKRGELGAAIACVQESLRKRDDPMVRLRLSSLAANANQPELVESDPARLPQPAPGLGRAAALVVQVLRHSGKNDEAIRFAYANYRLNRADSDAWGAVLAAFTPIPGPVGHVEPDVVNEEAALRIREDDQVEWIVMETHDPDASHEEFAPTHGFAKLLLGKKVGDRVQAPRGALPGREYVIEEVRSKFVRCYQQCLDRWERRYPETPGPQMFVLPEKLEDLDKLLGPMIAAQIQRVERLDRVYAEHDCSLHMLAWALGGSVFAAMAHVIAESGKDLKCAVITDRIAQAAAALDAGAKVVLHSTALSTLLLLDDPGLLKRYAQRIAVAEATIEELNAHLKEVLQGATGFLTMRDGRVVLDEKDETARSAYADRVRAMLEACRQCEVFTESDHSLIPAAEWDAWTRLGGAGAPESLHRTLRTRELLWVDDALVGAFAARRGVTTIWTQLFYEYAARIGLESSAANSVGARLAGWRFQPTRIVPGTFVAAAQLSRWNPAAWPLLALLDLISKTPWPADAVVNLCSNSLRDLWRAAPTDDAANAVTVGMLDRLLSRPGGARLVARVRSDLLPLFGLDVLTHRRADAAIQAWLSARGATRRIV